MSRTKKSAVNSVVGIIFGLVNSLVSFALQAVFIRLLGLEYSGINSLFNNILSILNLAELGISNAILFRLYKVIADKDEDGIAMYMAAYRKICCLMGSVITLAGIGCIPFLDKLIKETPAFPESLWSLFIIVLATNAVVHFTDYKKIYLIAKQDRFIVTIINYSTLFLCHGLQIILLWLTQNIYLYLLAKLFTNLLNAFITGYISRNKYHVVWWSKKSLPKKVNDDIKKDVGTLAVYKFCRTLDASIDTFLISKFVAVAMTAIYGSVSMILTALDELIGQFNDGIIAGVGDLYANKEYERTESVFYQSYHFTYLIYGICVSVLASIITPFVNWWIGYSLPQTVIYMMLLNFCMHGFAANVSTFRNSMGLFRKGWVQPAMTALLNGIFSVVLIQKVGLVGTLLGTLFARILTQVWFDPYIVCKYGLKKTPFRYYVRYVYYILAGVLSALIVNMLGNIIPVIDSFVSIIWHGVLYLLCSVILVFVFGLVIPEQKLLIQRIVTIVKQMIHKESN